MKRARILLADQHTLLMEGLTRLLEPEFEVVAAVTDGRALLRTAAELKPDAVVLDIALPSLNGLDAGYQLKKSDPRVRLIYLAMDTTLDTVAEAFCIGATSYLLKTSSATQLLTVIRLGLQGCMYVAPSLNRDNLRSFMQGRSPRKNTGLTFRQREVLQLLAEGRSMKEVAFALQITARTVAYHKYRMMDHLDLHSDAALFRFALSKQVA